MIGRKNEVKALTRLLSSKKSKFLAITGRRRIGKTYLIDTVLASHYCFSMTGIQDGNMAAQITNFKIKLTEYGFHHTFDTPNDWQEAFFQLKSYLKTLPNDKKQAIFIDELPWVATKRSKFLQFLAHLWNDYLSKESHFILIICGSATSWITQRIINDQGGLHNRVTDIIQLHPFTLAETKEFMEERGIKLTNQEITKIYMAFGGIPYYLEFLRKGESFAIAIERICFSKNAPLKNEYKNLYKALFNHADIHEEIIAVLAGHPNGLSRSQILRHSKMKLTGSFNRALEELVASDFITPYPSYGKKKRGSFYRLMDEYSIFYHRFIKPVHRYIPGIWQQKAASQTYKIWSGHGFESICHRHLPAIKKALGISAVYTEISSMHVPSHDGKAGFQLDLIIDRKDDSINLCEIKFYSGIFTINKSYYHQLIERRKRFIEYTGTKKSIFLTFISNHGIAKNKYAAELIDAEVTLDEIMNASINLRTTKQPRDTKDD